MVLGLLKREKLCDLIEEVLCESHSMRVDRENHVIRGVKILGRHSKNGYEYTDAAMDQAAPLYEGVDVAIDHDRSDINRERSLLESPGVLRNTHRQADGVYGDFHYLENHPATPMLLERIERGMPIGLSHNARGGFPVTRGNKRFVESVRVVKGVDLVLKPATTSTLFESEGEHQESTVGELLGKCEDESLSTFIENITADPMMADAPVMVGDNLSADEQVKAAFKAAVVALFEDESLDSKATLAKMKKMLEAYEQMKPEGEDMETKESIMAAIDEKLAPLVEDVKTLKHRETVNAVCAELGVDRKKLDKEHADLLESQETADGMRTLIESWSPAVKGAAKPSTGITNHEQPVKKTPRLINARR